jgi:multiple sugar transport system permease protein
MSLSAVGIANLLRDWPLNGFDNFAAAIADDSVRAAFLTTLAFVVTVLVLSVGIGLVAAFLIRSNSFWARLLTALMVFVWCLPPVVNGTLWKFLFSDGGAIGSILQAVGVKQPPFWLADPTLALWSVAFVTSWVTIPFVAIALKAGLLDIPREVIEAAQMDGASHLQVARHVSLPILRPVILVTAVLVVIYAFRSFDFVYVMTLGGPGTATTTVPFLGYKLSLRLFQFGEGAALGVTSIVLIGFLAALYVRAARADVAAK